MKCKIIITLCCCLAIYTFAGCQLAREDLSADIYEDKLIGMLLTTEYLDLFNFESYLNDNLNNFMGGNITVDDNTQKYQGRLYAALTTKILTNEETGETVETKEYVFNDILGYPYYYYTMPATAEHDSYNTSVSDEAISEGHTYINISDDNNSVALEGTIYISPSNENRSYYLNPVYQSADGSIYAVSGSGYSFNDESNSTGLIFTQTMNDTYTITENGKKKINSMSIEIAISVMFAPEKIVVLQMDKGGMILLRTEYEPDELPKDVTPETGTDYLIVETYKRGYTSTLEVSRAIYGKDADAFDTFFARSDGVCIKNWTQINWNLD